MAWVEPDLTPAVDTVSLEHGPAQSCAARGSASHYSAGPRGCHRLSLTKNQIIIWQKKYTCCSLLWGMRLQTSAPPQPTQSQRSQRCRRRRVQRQPRTAKTGRNPKIPVLTTEQREHAVKLTSWGRRGDQRAREEATSEQRGRPPAVGQEPQSPFGAREELADLFWRPCPANSPEEEAQPVLADTKC